VPGAALVVLRIICETHSGKGFLWRGVDHVGRMVRPPVRLCVQLAARLAAEKVPKPVTVVDDAEVVWRAGFLVVGTHLVAVKIWVVSCGN